MKFFLGFVFGKGAVFILQMRPVQLWSDPNAPLFQSRRCKNMVSFYVCLVWLIKTIRTHLSNYVSSWKIFLWNAFNSSITYTWFCQAYNQNNEEEGSVTSDKISAIAGLTFLIIKCKFRLPLALIVLLAVNKLANKL